MSSDRVPARCYMHTLETIVIAQNLLELVSAESSVAVELRHRCDRQTKPHGIE